MSLQKKGYTYQKEKKEKFIIVAIKTGIECENTVKFVMHVGHVAVNFII